MKIEFLFLGFLSAKIVQLGSKIAKIEKNGSKKALKTLFLDQL